MTQRDLTEEEEIQAWRKMERRRRTFEEMPLSDPKEPVNFAGDKAGTGRYILGFVLAGLFGVWAVYWARYYGWRGVWISLAIFGIVVFLVSA